MARKKANLSKAKLFAVLLIAAIVLFLFPLRITKRFSFLFVKIFNPVLSIGRGLSSANFKFIPSTKDFVTQAEYNRLLTAYENISADLDTMKKRYEMLAGIRTKLPKLGVAVILAEVMNSSVGGGKRELDINKGRNDGVRVGQYVLGQNSIIGTVNDTTKTQASVQLITDASHSMEIRICRKGTTKYIRAQLIGSGKNLCKIPLISTMLDIRLQDTVYAEVNPGLLETRTVIGKITDVKSDRKNPLLWDITVEPVCDAESLINVAVIVRNSQSKVSKNGK